MYDSCIMTWKTFLDLFRQDYSLFYYDGKNWYMRSGKSKIGNYLIWDIQIHLELFNNIIKDNEVYFLNCITNAITSIKQEELKWNPINKNIIIY